MNEKTEFKKLKEWIKANLIKRVTVNRSANSYYLKHLFEYETGIYVTEETFIKAMDELNYDYVQVGARDHDSRDYKIKKLPNPEYFISKGLKKEVFKYDRT